MVNGVDVGAHKKAKSRARPQTLGVLITKWQIIPIRVRDALTLGSIWDNKKLNRLIEIDLTK